MTDASGFVIAVVDDDQSVLDALEGLLESADYAVRVFASAAALIESPSLGEIDCLISDIGMPIVDGRELVRMVQAVRPGLPIFLITGHPEMLHRSPADEPGHYRVFRKPFDGQELLTAVADALQTPPPRPRRS
jgi:FixJ family two-component response regulator